MLGGREKNGSVQIDWQQYAFGRGTTKRKTVGFGTFFKKEKAHEFDVNIRELSIVDAGLGCAIWDAAIILSRWIWDNKPLFEGKVVHELGSGVGLPGILCAPFCKEMTVSDYIDQVIDNLKYNVQINANPEDDFDEVHTDEQKAEIERWRKKIGQIRVMSLDWDQIDEVDYGIPPVDIILGSELTYSPLSVESLLKVIEKYLAPGGWFYEILSEDRDGVALFVQRAQEQGWDVEITQVPEKYYGKFGTKQRPEKYRFYKLTRIRDRDLTLATVS